MGKFLWTVVFAINKYMAEHNRLGIPVLGEAESLHGLIHDGATIFPQSIALSSTFNPDITHRVATVIAQEAKATSSLTSTRPCS